VRPLEREIELDGLVALLADRHRAFSAYQRLVAAGPEALRALRQGIDSADPRVRSKCCQVLDELADATSFALLVGMLTDGHPRVRIDALHALACDRCKRNASRPKEEDVRPPALRLLRHDPNKYVRAMAAEVAGRWVHTSAPAREALLTARGDDPCGVSPQEGGVVLPGRLDLQTDRSQAASHPR
jgi:HEAT repeat protein